MFRGPVFSSFKLFILILAGNFFLKGQESNSVLNTPLQVCWDLPGRIAVNIASDNAKNIFIPLSNGVIKTININKVEVWKADLGGEIVNQPIYQKRTLYVTSKVISTNHTIKTGDITYSILALDTGSGISKWKKEFRSERVPILSLRGDRLVVILAGSTGNSGESTSRFNIIDTNTGNTIFEKSYVFGIKLFLNAFDEKTENIVILTTLNSIFSFSTLDGKTASFRTSLRGTQTGAVSDTGILLSNDRGIVYLITLTGEENKFKIRFGAGVTSIAQQKESILISSLDNFIYSVSLDGRRVNWKRRFPGRIIEKPITTPENIIAYSQGDNSLYFLNYDNGKMFNRVTVGDEEEIIGSPILLKNLLIVSTSKSIKLFSSGTCPSFAATEK
jgi:hypothetical protein